MHKIIILFSFFMLLKSATAMETFYFREGDDLFFQKQIKLLSSGTVEEKISAIYNLRAVRAKRALRPMILALKGVSSLTAKQTNTQTQEINPTGDYASVNFDLKQNNLPVVKYLAAQALAEIRQESAIKPLVEVYKELEETLTKKKNQRVFFEKFEEMNEVNAAAEVLRSIGTLLSDFEDKEAQELINNALKHEHFLIRSAAAEALANTDNDSAIPTLDAASSTEKNDYAKACMHASVVDIRKTNTKHFFELIKMLKSEDQSTRFKVSSLLGLLAIENSETYIRQAMMIEDSVNVKNQMKKDIVLITTYEVPNAPSASYGTEVDRNKKSDTKVNPK